MTDSFDKVVTVAASNPGRTPEDLTRLLDEAIERVRSERLDDPAWTTPRWVTSSMLIEAVVVGHMRAWLHPSDGSRVDSIVCEWANYIGACFKEDLKNQQTLLTLMPAVSAWLRDFPGYMRVSARFFDMDAAEQNVAAYLLSRLAEET